MTGVQTHGWSEKYAYDSTGNHTHAAAPHHPSSGDRAYEGALIRRAGRTTYEHDAAGRLIRKTRKLLNGQTRTWTYTWNPENRLTKSTTLSGEEWTYAYDPLGRRISKTGPDGTPLTFTWDSTQLAEQFASDGTATTWDYAPGTHRPVSQSTRQTLEARTDTANSILDLADTTPQSEFDARFLAIVTDLVGTPIELVTPDGALAWQSRTTFWGTPSPIQRAGWTARSASPVSTRTRKPASTTTTFGTTIQKPPVTPHRTRLGWSQRPTRWRMFVIRTAGPTTSGLRGAGMGQSRRSELFPAHRFPERLRGEDALRGVGLATPWNSLEGHAGGRPAGVVRQPAA